MGGTMPRNNGFNAYGQNTSANQNGPHIIQNPNSAPVIQPRGLEAQLQHRPTMNMPGAPTMPENPYALAAWQRNTPNAFGKRKIY